MATKNRYKNSPRKWSNDYLPFEKSIRRIEEQIAKFEDFSVTNEMNFSEEIEQLRRKRDRIVREVFSGLTPWQRVQLARHPNRPQASDYLANSFDEFVELFGDGLYGDDRAIITGFARIDHRRMMLIAQQKGKNLKEAMEANWGCPHPEGYRKALHRMKLAEKFALPVVTLIDTKGAYPGIGAEERGQSLAIANNLMAMASLRTPIVCVVVGEGGSGGALGIGVGDINAILEHAYYSVISPEGCAAILWKDGSKAPDAAEALKLTADELLKLGVVDEVIPEPAGGAHRSPEGAAKILRDWIASKLDYLSLIPVELLVRERYAKLRKIGRLREAGKEAEGGTRNAERGRDQTVDSGL